MTAAQKILDFLERSGLMDKIKQQLELEQKSSGNVIYFSEIAKGARRSQPDAETWNYYEDLRNILPFYPDFWETLRGLELYTLDSQVNFCCAVIAMLFLDMSNILKQPDLLYSLLP